MYNFSKGSKKFIRKSFGYQEMCETVSISSLLLIDLFKLFLLSCYNFGKSYIYKNLSIILYFL